MSGLHIHGVPKRLARKLVADAKRNDVSINEVAVRALVSHFGMTREEEDTRYVQGEVENLMLRLPEDVHTRIRMEAAGIRGATNSGVVLAALASHYGLPAHSPVRRSRRAA